MKNLTFSFLLLFLLGLQTDHQGRLNAAPTLKEELYNESNAVSDGEGMETNEKTGWGVWGPQYLKSFKSTGDNSPAKGTYHFELEGSNGATAYHSFNTEVGKSYRVTCRVRAESGGVIACLFTDNKEDPHSSIIAQKDSNKKSYQQLEINFKATTDLTHFGFRLTAREGIVALAYMDDVSIREVE